MPRRQRSTRQNIGKRREAEVELSQGAMAQACKKAGVTERTYCRWRKEYGGLPLDQAEHLRELEKENARLKRLLADMTLRNAIPKEAASGPANRTKAVVYQRRQLGEQIVSERRACRILSQNRSTQRRSPKVAGDRVWWGAWWCWQPSTAGTATAGVTAMPRREGRWVNHKRVERPWRREGLKVPSKQPKRQRWWLRRFLSSSAADASQSCMELRLRDDEDARRPPGPKAGDSGRIRPRSTWCAGNEPGSPWENGYTESFNGKLRDEPLNGEIFDTLLEAKVLIERWRRGYNNFQPQSAFGYLPPTP